MPVAAGIASFHDTDCNESMMKKSLSVFKKWNVGRILRDLQGKDESSRKGLRQD